MDKHCRQTCHQWPVGFITLIFFCLAVSYNIAIPIFESPDELWHYPFVWHLARARRLPVQNPADPQLWGQEGSQPPLYYALAALITAPIPTDDLPALIYRNPHADIGTVKADGNANISIHTKREAWPWRGAVLAIHTVRLFSSILAAGTLLTIYALARTLRPDCPAMAWLAMAFVAFNPMFLFIAASVNNDNLITLLAALTLLALVRLNSTAKGKLSIRAAIGLGLLTGLAALTKISGLGLLGLAGLTLLWHGYKQRSWRIAILPNALMSLVATAIAGWWYWRNYTLYGDWTGTENMVKMMGARAITPTAGQLWAELSGLPRSFWGLFGYFSVPLPEAAYLFFNLLLLAGLAGLMVIPLKKSRPFSLPGQNWMMLTGWLGLIFIGFLQWTLRTPATQGRLLFPALASLAVLWAAGWLAWIPPRLGWLAAAAMLTISAWIPFGVIAPAYARPAPIAELPTSAQPLHAKFIEPITLLGYSTPQTTIYPGDKLPLILFWQNSAPITTDYTLFIHLLDENDLVIAQRNLFHGAGVFPTSQWAANQPFADDYILTIPHTVPAPARARFEVGLYHHQTGQRLPLTQGGDHRRFGNIEIVPRQNNGWPNPQQLDFEQNISLIGYQVDHQRVAPGETVTLTLFWQSAAPPNDNYKIFVHLAGPDDSRAAQHDSDPQNGAAPTGSWAAGQVIPDEHLLSIAPEARPGAYQLIVGLYHPQTGQRLRLLANNGQPVQTDSIGLARIRIISH